MIRLRTINSTSTFLKHFYQYSLAKEGWRPCLHDIDCFLELREASVYVQEVDKKPVATMSVVKHCPDVCHLGSLYVQNDLRKQGYGYYISNAVYKIHDVQSTGKIVSCYVISPMVKMVEQVFGAVSHWSVGIYNLDVKRTLEKLQNYSGSFEVNTIDKDNKPEVFEYDRKVFGYKRNKFLEKWLSTPGSHARVALDKNGVILGYVVVRLAFFHDEGYKMGPLYCENIDVGKSLLKSVFQDVLDHGVSSSNSVIVDSPTGRNREAGKLMNFVGGKYLGCTYYMTKNGLPNACYDQWFAITSPVCG